MYLKVPIIARNNLGNSSILEHEKTGLIFDDPKQFCIHLRLLLNNPQKMAKICEQANFYFKNNFGEENEKKKYLQLFN